MTMIVTAITPQQKHRDRVNIFINHEYAFSGFTADLSRIRVGDTLTEADINAFKRADEESLAYSRALRFLSLRSRSRKEIIDYLARKGIDGETADKIVGRLEANGYVNDVEFARMWIENRRRLKPKGRRALKWELGKKGINEDVIEECLADVDEEESAWAAVLPKLDRWKGLEDKPLKQKIAGFLSRRGFGYDICRQIYEHVIRNASKNG